MFNAAQVKEVIDGAKHFGFTVGPTEFDWGTLKTARDNYVKRLNGIYANNLKNSKVELIEGVSYLEGAVAYREEKIVR